MHVLTRDVADGVVARGYSGLLGDLPCGPITTILAIENGQDDVVSIFRLISINLPDTYRACTGFTNLRPNTAEIDGLC
jgi:hypothetical protein